MFSHSDLSDENIYKVIDLLDVCIYWKDREGTYLGGNRYWFNLLGFKERRDILGKNDFAIFSKMDAERIVEIDRAVIQGTLYHREESARLINGEIKTAVTNKTPILDNEGKIVGLLGISTDITDIKNKMEMEKQQTILNEERKFLQIIDLVDAAIYWKDKEGRLRGCNQYLLNIFGAKTRDEIIGKDEYDLLVPDEALKINQADKLVLEKGAYHGEETFTIANGKKITMQSAKIQLLDDENNVVGIVGASLDITAQKEAELKIKNTEQKFWQIIDSVNASIYWKDTESRYLGCNKYVLGMAGISSRDEIIGKTDFEMMWKEAAPKLREVDNAVMTTGIPYEGEESFIVANKDEQHVIALTVKNPLLDKQGNIIGIIGTSLDITAQKEAEKLLLENEKQQVILNEEQKLWQIIDLVDASIYWKNTEGQYLGCNKYVLGMAGFNSRDEIMGKTDYDMVWKEDATKLREMDNLVMTTGTPWEGEEIIAMANKSNKQPIVFTVKNPLLDSNGHVIGIVGTSLDISAQKEAEELRIEAEKHKIIEEQQQEFRKIIAQVAHDMRSPVSAQRMNLNECKHYLPEFYRVAFMKSLNRIDDITYRLMSAINPSEKPREHRANPVKEPILVSNEILEVIAEKRYEYRERTVDFCEYFTESAYFAFLNTNALDFKRMLSNLINNAVDAIQAKVGRVDVHMDARDSHIQLMIQDNGSGMPEDVKEKILNNIAVTASKTDGHGIGFGQIHDTLKASEGELAIESQEGVGTKIMLTFPQVGTPNWIATRIKIFSDDIIVILDDDDSIHDAWEARFQKVAPNIERHHFREGKEAISFINAFDEATKKKVFLLTDYELLEQELHGLEVVEQTKVARSILVTSHNDSLKIRTAAQALNTKILPKPLAAHIPIGVKERGAEVIQPTEKEAPHKVDVVYVDDDEDLLSAVARLIRRQKKAVDTYSSAHKFLENKSLYPKDTKILLDNQFKAEYVLGLDIAQQLHEEGYTHLYLFSGENFDNDPDIVIPPYLTVIFKGDATDRLLEVLDE